MAQATPSTIRRGPRATLVATYGVVGALVLGLLVPFAVFGQDGQSSDLVGEYAVNIRKDDVPQDLANGATLIGIWQFSFTADGAYTGDRQDVGNLINGTYQVDGDKVTLTDGEGLLSCANPAAQSGDQGDVSAGTYQWTRTGERLSLVPVEDGCASRRVLLATREFDAFVACSIEAGAGELATPVAEGSPVVEGSPIADGSPVAEAPSNSLAASPEAEAPDSAASPEAVTAADQAIDNLLDQMTSCWSTGDPDRFLPLMSDSFRAQFLAGAAGDPVQAVATLMASTQFIWARAGEVTVIDETHASAIVRQTVGAAEDFLRYIFVFEDGAWRWDGTG